MNRNDTKVTARVASITTHRVILDQTARPGGRNLRSLTLSVHYYSSPGSLSSYTVSIQVVTRILGKLPARLRP